MSNYKNYLLLAMGVKEGQIKPSIVERNIFPDIDPDELEMGSDEEKDEHGMSPEEARQTAAQHLEDPGQKHYYTGIAKAKRQGMLKDALLSPTAIATPVIAVAVRGSSTGGLPSGADQLGDISPSCLGGYEKIPVEPVNSKLVNKTPSNPNIIQLTSPIVDDPTTDGAVTHPHQVQKDAGQEPQSVTGASTDSDDTLKLKSAAPKGIDIDVAEESNRNRVEYSNANEDENTYDEPRPDVNETFARHIKLMNTNLHDRFLTESKHKAGCKCGFCANKGSFGKKDKAEECKKEEEEDKVEKVEEKYSAPFEKMRGLANLGERRVASNGLWESAVASEPFNTHWKMDKEKAGMVKVDEESQPEPHDLETDQFAPGPRDRMEPSQPTTKGSRVSTEKLKSLKGMLSKKSDKGTLGDKELRLLRGIDASLKARGEE